jgi:hypothetical protein
MERITASSERAWAKKCGKKIAEVLKRRDVLFNGNDIDRMVAPKMAQQMLRLYGVKKELQPESIEVAKRYQPQVHV